MKTTATALFRRFLIERGLKQKFETEWKREHPRGPALMWNNDFLSYYLVECLGRPLGVCWRFLSPKRVFDWNTSTDGLAFWDAVSIEWGRYYRNNHDKTNVYKIGSYAGN